MKIIHLAVPAIVGGALRYPVENPLTVPDTEAEHLRRQGKLDGAPVDEGEGDADADDLGTFTVAELREYADSESIDLGDASKKADILAVIRARSAN